MSNWKKEDKSSVHFDIFVKLMSLEGKSCYIRLQLTKLLKNSSRVFKDQENCRRLKFHHKETVFWWICYLQLDNSGYAFYNCNWRKPFAVTLLKFATVQKFRRLIFWSEKKTWIKQFFILQISPMPLWKCSTTRDTYYAIEPGLRKDIYWLLF